MCVLVELGVAELCWILPPAVSLLVSILQVHYFNEHFLETTSLHNIPIQQKGTPDRYLCPQGGNWRFC
jgi:hypothetical protein